MTRPVRLLAGLLLGLCALMCVGAPALAQDFSKVAFPELTGQVVDAADVIPPAEEARITAKLAALETQSRRQVVVATVPSLQGYEASDYAYQLGRKWGIGSKERNDGLILLVAPNERKVQITVGYGLEPVVTDALSWIIIRDQILPRFKAGDMPGGIEAGVDALVTQLQLPPEEAAKVVQNAAEARQGSGDGGIPIGAILFMLVVIFFFILPLMRAMRGGGGRRRGGFGGPIIWVPGGSDWGGGGGGFGGFGGGGGFSGGGGSFGGGGAGGSW